MQKYNISKKSTITKRVLSIKFVAMHNFLYLIHGFLYKEWEKFDFVDNFVCNPKIIVNFAMNYEITYKTDINETSI